MRISTLSAGLFAALSLCLSAAPEQELKDPAGKTIIRYVAEVPAGLAAGPTADPGRQVGLFLCFPEHDRPTGDELYPVREALKRQGLQDQYILIGGHPQGQKFGPADYEPIQALLAWALKTYPINPRRVYMYGKGEGGKISGELAMAYPEKVAAAISYSWTWWKMPTEKDKALDPERYAQFYMVLGLRDLSHHLTNVRDGFSRTQAKGVHVLYREIADLGARTYHPASNDDAIAWATRLRNRAAAPSRAERAQLARPVLNRDGYYANIADVGGPEAGAVIAKLLDSPSPSVRLAAARTCAEGNFGEAAMEVLAKRMTDSSPGVRREALRSLAVNANWRSAAAQRALAALAQGVIAPIDEQDRVTAADGLVYAARFQINGFRQDPQLFRALVALSDGDNDELRTIARNALATIRDPQFRGDLGRKEATAPEGGWAAWLDGVTTKAEGYLHDYRACHAGSGSEAMTLYCKGGGALRDGNAAEGFQLTLRAAELGSVPAQAAVGMLYAIGKGTEQNVPAATQWWLKAAEAGHELAALNVSMSYRMGMGQKADREVGARWTKRAAEITKVREKW